MKRGHAKAQGRLGEARRVRGQADAPIELVIAIIILVTSMGLAFHIMGQIEAGKCLASLKTQTQQLQEAMMDVALGSASTKKTVVFNMPSCGEVKVKGLQFVQFKDTEYCRLCPGHYGGCWQIIPIRLDQDGNYQQLDDAISCIDLPPENVNIMPGEPGDGCEPLSTNPCLVEDSCSSAKTGVPYNGGQWLGGKGIWQTLGKKEAGTATYVVTLTKGVTAGAEGYEKSRIIVCAKPAN